MANQEHLDILKQGVQTWNRWRQEHADIQPDLGAADLREVDLSEADFIRANLLGAKLSHVNLRGAQFVGATLSSANLSGANLSEADFSHANLKEAQLLQVDLGEANLSNADLSGAHLSGNLVNASLVETCLSHAHLHGAHLSGANLWTADLSYADLSHAHLRDANLNRACLNFTDLSHADLVAASLGGASLIEARLIGAHLDLASLVGANLSGADLSGAELSCSKLEGADFTEATLTNCRIYGVSAWSVELKGARQNDLLITRWNESAIVVDTLKFAQFIDLLLNSVELRQIIDTIARKAVLIVGRFTSERKAVLDALREALRIYGYVPIFFDGEKPHSRNATEMLDLVDYGPPRSRSVTEMLKTLAHLSRFIIADFTDPSSISEELGLIVPGLAVPVQPILQTGEKAFAMFPDLPKTYHWVLPTHSYTNQTHLHSTLQEHVIAPVEQKAQELAKR